jgi:DNA-binding winged helix-turn-helix (wHTH) protein
MYPVVQTMSAAGIPHPPVIRFGVFEVDLQARELRKRGMRIKLQDQPFQVLITLLEQPGQTVTREQLQKKLWSDDTFVDFDRAVNKAINRIREALGDLTATPRFIETMPRRGYRFIAPIARSAEDASIVDSSAGRQSKRLIRSSLLPPQGTSFTPSQFALSPDGTLLAFAARGADGQEALYVRDLSGSTAQRLNGTESARLPFWSPDSRRLGFFRKGKLSTVGIAGGSVRALCDVQSGWGGAWNADNVIIFAGHVRGPLHRIAASGGTPAPVTPQPEPDSSQLHCWPVFLPGGDQFLFFVNRTGPRDALRHGIYAGSLSSPEVNLVSADIDGNLAYACGRVFFVRGGALNAQAFDLDSLQLISELTAVVQNELEIWDRVMFQSGFSVSETGIVVFQSSIDFAPELVWMDASGNECGRIPQRGYWQASISPDGKSVAVSSDESHTGRTQICVHDLERGVTTRLTDGDSDWQASWSSDGTRIIFDSTKDHISSTHVVAADGSDAARLLLEPENICAQSSRNGDIAFTRFERGQVMLFVKPAGADCPMPLEPGVEVQFSPDGNWLAFSVPSGAGISLRPYPGPGPRIQVSRGPAAQPRWSHDGRQLFYTSPDKKLWAVDFDSGTGRVSAPRELFQTRIVRTTFAAFQYDVTPDGHFLINSLPSGTPPLTILTGWDLHLRP